MARERNRNESSSLATTASDQLRAILTAAEQAAAQIRAQAEEDAGRIRAEAEAEATGIRSQGRSDIRALIESIRSGLSRVRSDLELLEAKLTPASTGEEVATPVQAPARQDEAPQVATPGEPPAQSEAEFESARLVALNMALDGNATREEIDRYLRENFELADCSALLDEVFASVGL